MSPTTKMSLRHYYRHLRRQFSSEQKSLASQAIANIFFNHFFWIPRGNEKKMKKNMAVYLAHDGEISLMPLIEKLWQTSCSVFLPMIQPDTQTLRFVEYTAITPMRKNQYGILEPDNTSSCIMPNEMDMVLIPLVAFDSAGARLGMGKGYYDHSFSFRHAQQGKPLLIGVAYEDQYCAALPTDAWDVLLDGVITEKELRVFNEMRKHE